MNTTKKAWLNIGFFIITLVLNTLGAIGLINGLTQKQISDMYVTLITPSPATFSIWSVIYSALLISLIVMVIKKDNNYYEKAINKISTLFIVSSLLNIAWIISFSFVLVEISTFFIIGFLLTLVIICTKLLEIQDKNRWLLPLSFGLYSGWLFIATVVNISASLVKLQWSGFGLSQEIWGSIILIIAIALLFIVVLRIRNAIFPLPVAWAYFGIYSFLRSPVGFKGEYGTLQTIALIGVFVLVTISAFQFYRNRFMILPESSNDR